MAGRRAVRARDSRLKFVIVFKWMTPNPLDVTVRTPRIRHPKPVPAAAWGELEAACEVYQPGVGQVDGAHRL